jgi:glyoxylase-like metal-dependent hydrolase (beta-lactamase superfamily II)
MEVESFVVPPLDNNVYLVYDADSKEAVLVDTSLSAAKVLPRIRDLGLALKIIMNTHGHADHVADNAPIALATGAKIGIHEADAYRLERVAKEENPYLAKPPPPSKADVLLKEGTVVKIGPTEILVLHTPGHTEGSSSFYVVKERYLFTGDTLFERGFGDTDGLGSSPAKLWNSLHRLYRELPPETRVLPGHGPPTRLADETWIENVAYATSH